MFSRLKRVFKSKKMGEPQVLTQHALVKDKISPNAVKVLMRLQEAGYDAHIVGGGVRDMLLGQRPKDFDVVTNARPKDIRQVFRNSRLIGRRFRLVHVYFPNEIIEVSTFRTSTDEVIKDPVETDKKNPEMLSDDNVYGTIEEDAWRRDFTVNALYYNIENDAVIDYTGGLSDLDQKTIRIIGDAAQRYHEDPIRLLRAIRMAARLNFKIHPETREPLLKLPHLLRHVPSSRLFDEVIKLFFEGHAYDTFELLKKSGYLTVLLPGVERTIQHSSAHSKLVDLAMQATDTRFASNQPLNPGFLFAVMLWPVMQEQIKIHYAQHKKLFTAVYHGMNKALEEQMQSLMIPRRLTAMMRSMWILQYHLERRRKKRIYRIFNQRFFRAAFDFLLLRAQIGEPVGEIAQWWQQFRDGDKETRARLIDDL